MKLLGVWLLIGCLGELISAVQTWSHMMVPFHTTYGAYLLHAGVDLIAGLYLLMDGQLILGLAGWQSAEQTDENAHAGETGT